MAPVSSALHRQGIHLLRYLDDWLILAVSQHVLTSMCSTLRVIINWEKSSITPTQMKTFFLMEIHSPLVKVFPTQKRLENLRYHIISYLFSATTVHQSKSGWYCKATCPPSSTWYQNKTKGDEHSTTAYSDVGQTVTRRHSFILGQQ